MTVNLTIYNRVSTFEFYAQKSHKFSKNLTINFSYLPKYLSLEKIEIISTINEILRIERVGVWQWQGGYENRPNFCVQIYVQENK